MTDGPGPTSERIAEMFARVGIGTHYDMLGVEPTADRDTIRRAWFDLAKEFHPDRFFLRDLGPDKPRFEAIFGAIMRAGELLSRDAFRRAYDRGLVMGGCRTPQARCPRDVGRWSVFCVDWVLAADLTTVLGYFGLRPWPRCGQWFGWECGRYGW